MTAIVLFVGIVSAVEYTAFNQSFLWFGIDWQIETRRFLIDKVGVPNSFVRGYVSFGLIDFPAWVCYWTIALAIGFVRSNWTNLIGYSFVGAIVIWDLMSDFFSGMQEIVNLRLVSLFGAFVALLCFYSMRKLRHENENTENETRCRRRLIFSSSIFVASFCISAYGWWLVDLHRQAGMEFQETVEGTLLDLNSNNN